MLEHLSANDFSDLPDGKLAAAFGEEDIVLEIAEIRQLAAQPRRAVQPCSILLRERGARRALPQGIYAYRHPQRGALHLFTVPVGPDAQGMLYEIILN